MHSVRSVTLALAAGLAVAASTSVAQAQRGQPRPIELGIDAALAYEDRENSSLTSFSVPVPRLRVGFFVGDAVSLEPFFSLQYNRVEIDELDESFSATQYDLGLGILFHFATDRTRSQPYVRPFVGISGISADDGGEDDDDSASQPVVGAGFGLKLPSSSRLGTRLEVGFARRFEDEPAFQSSNQLFLSFGLSFFTR